MVAEPGWSQPVEVVWEGGMKFRGGRGGGPQLRVDGDSEAAPSPVEALVVALGSCSAVDVIEVLAKRRTPAGSLSVRVDFLRAANPPRRLIEAKLHYAVQTESAPRHIERAVQLSFDKYCSVAASLAPDTRFSWTIEVAAAKADGQSGVGA